MTSLWPAIHLPRHEVGASPGDLVPQIDAWLGSEPLRALVEAFGGGVESRDGQRCAEELDEFASRVWDFRKGRERNLAQDADLSSEQADLAVRAAQSLGLVGSRPPSREHYDAVLILGGLVRACVSRPRHVANLLSAGTTFDEVVALGGFRELAGDEIPLARRLAISGDNEFEAMTQGLQNALDVRPVWTDEGDLSRPMNARWTVRTAAQHEPPLHVIAAPSSDPTNRRANTVDTYRFYAARSAPGPKHLLIVTNPVYVPYQGCGATQTLGLGYDWSVETVGADQAASDLGDDTQVFGPQQYLQELRSAIYGMRTLRQAATEPHDE